MADEEEHYLTKDFNCPLCGVKTQTWAEAQNHICDYAKEPAPNCPKSPTKTEEILRARGPKYGPAKEQFVLAQSIKGVFRIGLTVRKTLYSQSTDGGQSFSKELPPQQIEALEMIAMKISRAITGDADYADTWRDISGYAELIANEIEKGQTNVN